MSPPTSSFRSQDNNLNWCNNSSKFKNKSTRKRAYYFSDRMNSSYYSRYTPLTPWYNSQGPKRFKNRGSYRRAPNNRRSRSPSPFSGTEEYNLKKIQETSDMIKKQLSMPPQVYESQNENKSGPIHSQTEVPPKTDSSHSSNDSVETPVVRSEPKVNKTPKSQYNIKDIHNKIVDHITNLSLRRKINLISSPSTSYDAVIQNIQKQRRLEVSKAFREMCSNQTPENTKFINSIIPDIGISIEDLPLDVIQQLSNTLNFDFDQMSDNNGKLDDFVPNIEVNADFNQMNRSKIDQFDPNIFIKAENIESENELDNISLELKDESDENFDQDGNFNEEEELTAFESINSSIGVQTDDNSVCLNSTSTQTENEWVNYYKCALNETHIAEIQNIHQAVDSMYRIDKEVARLTKLRQMIFVNLRKSSSEDKRVLKKRKGVKKNKKIYEKELQFEPVQERILVTKVHKEILLIATENGELHLISLENGATLHTAKISVLSITSLCPYSSPNDHANYIYIGSLENSLKVFDLDNKLLLNSFQVSNDGIQCMELMWNFIFIGSCCGELYRFALKKNKIEFKEKLSDSSVLVLKATLEGGRRVLLVGSRNSPVCIRDAMSGLLMRTLDNIISPTVYSMLLEDSLVYCGTVNHDILIFKFHDGELVNRLTATNSKGVACMKIVNNLLFTGCHDGNIYVHDIKSHNFVGSIAGSEGVILSMEVYKNLIIVSTLLCKFKSILIPDFILLRLLENT